MEKDTIPAQRKGAHVDVRDNRLVEERADAIAQYERAKSKLLDITHWGDFAHEAPEGFILTDASGNVAMRQAEEGNHIKIHLPGPRSASGDGAEWVKIEKITEKRNKMLDETFAAMTVRPCPNPQGNEKTVAHFYDDWSTNTFLIRRHKIEHIVSIHGRNEMVNTDTNWPDMFRNLMVALPAKAGFLTRTGRNWQKV